MVLLDTNVVSEVRRRKPDLHVKAWIDTKARQNQFLSAISLTEIAYGASRHPDPVQRKALQLWMDGYLRIWFQHRVLALTADIAETAGSLIGTRQRAGKPLSLSDALVAATAMKHALTLVTRNTKDFVDLSVDVYDPWESMLTLGTQRP